MAFDGGYEKYVRKCINSITQNWENHPKIIAYCKDISESFRQFILASNVEIRQIIGHEYKNLGPVGNTIVYNKYECWNPTSFGEYDNVLHLDCDTIIKKPLDSIFTGNSTFFNNNEILDGVKSFKNSNLPMCNAGVFVVNKKNINISDYNELIENTIKFSSEALFADQSIISLWCYLNDITLSNDVYYNFQPHFMNYSHANYSFEDIKVIHFTAKKPDTISFDVWWRLDNYADLFYKEWKKYE